MTGVTYALIVWMYVSGAGGPATVGEFSTRAACDSAGIAFVHEVRGAYGMASTRYFCVVLDRR